MKLVSFPEGLALLLLPTLGCQTTSYEVGPVPDAATDAGADANCNACDLAAASPGGACYGQVTTCNESTSCTALSTCLGDCAVDDATCINACATASAGAVSDYNAVGQCLCATHCASLCGASCSGVLDAGAEAGGDGGTERE